MKALFLALLSILVFPVLTKAQLAPDVEFGPVPAPPLQNTDLSIYQSKVCKVVRVAWCVAIRQEIAAESQNALKDKTRTSELTSVPVQDLNSTELEGNLENLGSEVDREAHEPHLLAGEVTIQFTINADGFVSIKEAKGDGAFLRLCSIILLNAQPFDAFSDSMRKSVGNDYSDSITFRLLNSDDHFSDASEHINQAKLPSDWGKAKVAGVKQVSEEKEASGFPKSSAPSPRVVASFAVYQSDVSGKAGALGDNSPAAMATELGRYKAKVYRAVGSYWYAGVNKQIQLLGVGTVHITYTIHSDGSMEIIADPDKNNASLMLLHTVSVQAMMDSAPFDAFSDPMVKEVGESYTDDFSFSVIGDNK